MKKRMLWAWVAVVSVAILASAAATVYALVIRPLMLRGRQIENLGQMRVYSAEIECFHQSHGLYPASAQDAPS